MAKSDEDMGNFSTSESWGEAYLRPALWTGLLPRLPTSWARTKSVTRSEELIEATQGQAGSSSFLFVCLLSQPPDTLPVGEDGEELSPAPTPSVSIWDNPFSFLEILGQLRA